MNSAAAHPSVTTGPYLARIRIATIGVADPRAVAVVYTRYLGYRRRAWGRVSKTMAYSWGAGAMAGRDYELLSSDGDRDVFIRLVAVDPAHGYAALTTSGWNGVEIIVDRIAALYERLKDSPFVVRAPPAAPVKSYPTIRSMTVEGPAHETLYLTSETGDRDKSILPKPRSQVGRPFVVWVTGPDILPLRDWYAKTFAMTPFPSTQKPIEAHGATPGATMPNTVLLLKDRGNLIQFEGNPAQYRPRPHAEGQLPPGNAMASFGVEDLDALSVKFIRPPTVLYGGRRAATCFDPNGNRIELIEEPAKRGEALSPPK